MTHQVATLLVQNRIWNDKAFTAAKNLRRTESMQIEKCVLENKTIPR